MLVSFFLFLNSVIYLKTRWTKTDHRDDTFTSSSAQDAGTLPLFPDLKKHRPLNRT